MTVRRRSLVLLLTLTLLVVLGDSPGAQAPAEKKPAPKPAGKHVMVMPDQLNWGTAPPALPAGAQVAVLDGDPAKAGMFSIRIKMPDGYTVQPHWHPTDEHLVILSGSLSVGVGDKFDDSSMHALTAGAFTKMPRRMHHYVRAKGETIFQLYAMGPFVLNYVNPEDDPRRKKTN
jgi:mannose-6-phosphate isomerase-like protein (cupin superfamily)